MASESKQTGKCERNFMDFCPLGEKGAWGRAGPNPHHRTNGTNSSILLPIQSESQSKFAKPKEKESAKSRADFS
jgi:hypothetical protein